MLLQKMSFICLILICNSISQIPDRSYDYNSKGIAALNKNDYQNAILNFENALKCSNVNETIKKNLTNTYNNYAIELSKKGNFSEACLYLEKAFSLEPTSLQIKSNLKSLYLQKSTLDFNSKEYSNAEIILKKLLKLEECNTLALINIGKIAYLNQKLSLAEKYWKKALMIEPGNKEIIQLLSSIQKEGRTEDSFSQVQGDIFEIHYNQGVIDNEIYEIKQHLMDCYREIGQDFGYFPKHTIIVLLYKESEFRGLRDVHDKVSGLFDGKIRIPVNLKKYSLQKLKEILNHEFTHALIFDLAGNECPIWLNEGLAVFEERTDYVYEKSIMNKAKRTNNTFSILQLNNSSTWRKSSLAPLAYSQSYVMVKYMIDRWGLYVINDIIRQIQMGNSFESVLESKTNCSLTEFEQGWKKSIAD